MDTFRSAMPSTFDTLEYEKALLVYERCFRTDLGRELLRRSAPIHDADRLRTRFSEIERSRRFLEHGRNFPFQGIRNLDPILRKAEIPGSLCEGLELAQAAQTLQGIHRLQKSLAECESPLGPLLVYLDRLIPQRELEAELVGAVDEEGVLRDSASPELKKVRTQIRTQRTHIQRRLEEMVRRPQIREILQEEYYSERRGRYVLPVQAASKRKIQGIQHGRSDTGATVYIEPIELVEAGNLLAEAMEEEEREVVRILSALTGRLRGEIPTLRANLETVAEFDLVFSLGEYALGVEAAVPAIVDSGELILRQMRHPLLLAQMHRSEVVPNDLILGGEAGGILITGPNTGGKTVVLKCAGLLSLLALSGLPIPCEEGTQIPLLAGVFADIGDDQSIEQSLSTFSSHVSRMKAFLESVRSIHAEGGRSLVILDEPGGGTDPAEGAALSRAYIEELLELGAWTIVATHLGDLKLFAFEHPRLKSCSMRFDGATLAPTFELLIDTVGESHGLEIADRLGLPAHIVEKARLIVESNPSDAAQLLHRLTEEERRARTLREEIETAKQEIEEKRETLLRRIEQTAKSEQRILDTAKREAESRIQSAKRRFAQIEELIKKEEAKVRQGFSGKEAELVEREKKIAWLERDLEHRLKQLMEWAARFPNLAPEMLKPYLVEKQRLERLREPEWKQILREIEGEEEQIRSEFPSSQIKVSLEESERPDWAEIREGDLVSVEGIERPVSVIEKSDRKKRLRILVGSLESDIPFTRVIRRFPREGATPKAEPVVQSPVRTGYTPSAAWEINLIGRTVEEMETDLLKYLDEAALTGYEEVRVIHGFGTGALRDGVRRILDQHPIVLSHRPGQEGEGGGGATVVRFRR